MRYYIWLLIPFIIGKFLGVSSHHWRRTASIVIYSDIGGTNTEPFNVFTQDDNPFNIGIYILKLFQSFKILINKNKLIKIKINTQNKNKNKNKNKYSKQISLINKIISVSFFFIDPPISSWLRRPSSINY